MRSPRSISPSLADEETMIRRVVWRTVSAIAIAAASARAQQLSGGQLAYDTVHATSLERNLYGDSPDRSVMVYLPQSYASSPNKRYPVVYLLHGYGGTQPAWPLSAPIKPAIDTLFPAGVIWA